MGLRRFLAALFGVILAGTACAQNPRISIGGKNFNEGYILAEIMSQLLEANGFTVERRFGLQGTLVCFTALENGEISAYPEYTGTIEQAILKLDHSVTMDSLRGILQREYRLDLLPAFGFNNTYALAVDRRRAETLGLRKISDLQRHPECKIGFSSEFLNRPDGWLGLRKVYRLPQHPRGMEHGLAYLAIKNGEIDVTDAYSTDGDIPRFDLVLLEDDRHFFPVYLGAPLVRMDMPGPAREVLARLGGKLDEKSMQRLNAQVVVDGKTFAEVAATFLHDSGLVRDRRAQTRSMWPLLWRRTVTHIKLTALALLAAMFIAIPAGVMVYRLPKISRPIIYFAGLLQTVPSIALLAFMIPLLGIGQVPAIVALFLYALLPILRNTAIALFSVDPLLKKVSVGMGMTTWQRLRYVEMPLAGPTILAGIKTAAVINIGTATLAAFIGAGGLGEPIVTGLALNDPGLILQGAVPAAILAIIVEFLFEIAERVFIPAHLLQKASA